MVIHTPCAERACQAVRGCTSAAPSITLGCGLWLHLGYSALPKEITAGLEQSAPVFPKLRHAARAGCRPSTSCLPNSCACHGAAVMSQACRATRRRIRSQVGARPPCFCTMLLLLLLLLLPALREWCPWHSTIHHDVALQGSVTSQPCLRTETTPLSKNRPWNAPPPHVPSGGRGSRRGGTLRPPLPPAPHLLALAGRHRRLFPALGQPARLGAALSSTSSMFPSTGRCRGAAQGPGSDSWGFTVPRRKASLGSYPGMGAPQQHAAPGTAMRGVRSSAD